MLNPRPNPRVRRLACTLFLLSGLTIATRAQSPTAPTFDTASVKINRSGDARTDGRLAGTRFSMLNETLWRLIGEAYATSQPLPRSLIVGGPDWLNTDRFDVEGVAVDAITRETARLMLRAVLADRFQLRVHTETRELPVYELVVAQGDGKLGPQLRRSSIDCAAPPPPSSPTPNQPPPCVLRFGFGRLEANGVTITQLAASGLSRVADRIVVDHTGLTGAYDWTLVWTPDNLPPRAPGTPAGEPIRVNGAVIDPDGPSLFTALREQLGLKVQPINGPVDVVVIDRAEHPSEN